MEGGKSRMDANGGHGNLTAHLETNRAERSMWLMKCPALVSRSLQTTDDPSHPVAKVVLSVDPLASNDDSSSSQFTMELARAESGNAPKNYALDMSTDFIPMSVFSESSQGKLSVEGKILNKFDMRPRNDNIESYGRLCRERTKKYLSRNRQTQVIDNVVGICLRPTSGMIIPTGPPKKVGRSSETKRTRRDRGEMEGIMFKLFERQSNWTLRQLIQETDQPEQFLKDLLKDLCFYNNKGSNQGSYELKPEYKKASNDQISN